MGIRLARFVVERLRRRGDDVELIDAKAINLPMLDRMYKEYPKGEAPEALRASRVKIRDADGFVFVTGEYNWGVQPGLKNLTDHFLEEWFWRPAAIASYSAGRFPARGLQPPGTATLRDGNGGDLEHHCGRCRSARPYRPKPNPSATRKGTRTNVYLALPMTSRGG